MNATNAKLAAAALALQGQSPRDLFVSLVPLIVLVLVFWFLVILPQVRRQKKTTAMLAALKPGDKVITNGGIYGTITNLEPDAVHLRVAEQVKIKVARAAIAGLQKEQEP